MTFHLHDHQQAPNFPAGITNAHVGRLYIRDGLVDPAALFEAVYTWNIVSGIKQPTPDFCYSKNGPLPRIDHYTKHLVWCHYESKQPVMEREGPWMERDTYALRLVRDADFHTVIGYCAAQRCDNACAESISLIDWSGGVTLVMLSSEIARPHVCLVDTAALRAVLAKATWKGA